jgi:hypothetical protein
MTDYNGASDPTKYKRLTAAFARRSGRGRVGGRRPYRRYCGVGAGDGAGFLA